jgi:hypothetical protein
MTDSFDAQAPGMATTSYQTRDGIGTVLTLDQVRQLPAWSRSFAHLAKDHRYHEIVDETLRNDFEFFYLVIRNGDDRVIGIQPFFLVHQDFFATAHPALQRFARIVRRVFPRFFRPKILMAGCAAGEGHPGAEDEDSQKRLLRAAAQILPKVARHRGITPIVWKDFPSCYRNQIPSEAGPRLASMPATRLALEFDSFDDYMRRHLSHATRKDLRRKLKATRDVPLVMRVQTSVAAEVDTVHGLYQQVLSRAKLQFERLPREFFLRLGERMPDRARFFLWHSGDQLVACSICLAHDGILSDEYLGLDYQVALDWHLYFRTLCDLLKWAIDHKMREYRSTPLNYAPKRQFGFSLAPLDLYLNLSRGLDVNRLRGMLRAIEPTGREPILRDFPNANEL